MLKIKDNVDLKELEKYGFEKVDYYELMDCYVFKDCGRVVGRVIFHNRKLKINSSRLMFDVLYDLIKDGLVEKVEE